MKDDWSSIYKRYKSSWVALAALVIVGFIAYVYAVGIFPPNQCLPFEFQDCMKHMETAPSIF